MPQAEFGIVLTQVRSYVFSIQDSVSHRIGNPVWIYSKTDNFFHTTITSHYVLDNTIWLLLLYSHTGLDEIGSDWIRLDQFGSDWIRLDQIGSDWIRLDKMT